MLQAYEQPMNEMWNGLLWKVMNPRIKEYEPEVHRIIHLQNDC